MPETSNSSIVFSQSVLTETKDSHREFTASNRMTSTTQTRDCDSKAYPWSRLTLHGGGGVTHHLRSPPVAYAGTTRRCSSRERASPSAYPFRFGTTDEGQEVPSDRQYGARRTRGAALRGGIAGGVGFFPIGRSIPSGDGSGRWGERARRQGTESYLRFCTVIMWLLFFLRCV
jgi:hypothetical protein